MRNNKNIQNRFTLWATLTILCLPVFSVSRAQVPQRRQWSPPSDYQQRQQVDFGLNNAPQDDFADAYEVDQARQQQAEANFDAIMVPQNAAPAQGMKQPPRSMRRLFEQQQVAAQPSPAAAAAVRASVELSLKQFLDVRERLQKIRKEAGRRLGPAVVLGSSDYKGTAIQGALRLELALQVTLGRPGKWKTVPLIGDDVVLVEAKVGDEPVPVSRRSGYHVWATRRSGEVTIQIELLVPARGPRGSIEYDFLVPRTPVTSFACTFPVPGLEPRLDTAVQSEALTVDGKTELKATLRPTARIHLVGFKDLGAAEGREAKIYSESLNLLSIDEGALDLFTVVRYTILYAGTKEFDIRIPEGFDVVSADGMGAFRFDLAEDENGRVIKGETAFPIRNNYEISIRLHRETQKEGETFDAPIPRCVGVEREIGHLAVEVPGKLRLQEGDVKQNITAIDVRQLPEEMVRSAVSPILRAYRYHSNAARLSLITTQLPDREPESDSIDRIRAFTTVNSEGHVMTDMRITLRNRMRHSLVISIPEGTEVRSALLDGRPVKPSKNDQGRLMLPLKRSSGGEQPRPFTISVVMHSETSSLGFFGCGDLLLPAVDLPVSSLAWSVYLPARNIYTALEGNIETQKYSGRGSWHRPSYSYQEGQWENVGQPSPAPVLPTVDPVASAHTGAMPVRIKLPGDGVRLEYSRYWIDKGIEGTDAAEDRPVEVSFYYARSWLRIPAWMALAVILAIGILLVSAWWLPDHKRPLPWAGGAVVLAALWPTYKLGGLLAIFLAVVLGFLLIAWRRRWLRKIPEGLAHWAKTLRERFHKRQRDKDAWTSGWVARKIALTIGILFIGVYLLWSGLQLLWLLLHPL